MNIEQDRRSSGAFRHVRYRRTATCRRRPAADAKVALIFWAGARHTPFGVSRISESPIPELVPPDKGAPQAPRSNGCEGRVIRLATARDETFAVTVNGEDTIGVIVDVDLERGAPGSDNPEKQHGR